MHCSRRHFVVWMSDLCSKCPLFGFHKIQTKAIKCRQFSPSPCLFAEPEAVSKHSVSLWIGYSEYVIDLYGQYWYVMDLYTCICEVELKCCFFQQSLYAFRFNMVARQQVCNLVPGTSLIFTSYILV